MSLMRDVHGLGALMVGDDGGAVRVTCCGGDMPAPLACALHPVEPYRLRIVCDELGLNRGDSRIALDAGDVSYAWLCDALTGEHAHIAEAALAAHVPTADLADVLEHAGVQGDGPATGRRAGRALIWLAGHRARRRRTPGEMLLAMVCDVDGSPFCDRTRLDELCAEHLTMVHRDGDRQWWAGVADSGYATLETADASGRRLVAVGEDGTFCVAVDGKAHRLADREAALTLVDSLAADGELHVCAEGEIAVDVTSVADVNVSLGVCSPRDTDPFEYCAKMEDGRSISVLLYESRGDLQRRAGDLDVRGRADMDVEELRAQIAVMAAQARPPAEVIGRPGAFVRPALRSADAAPVDLADLESMHAHTIGGRFAHGGYAPVGSRLGEHVPPLELYAPVSPFMWS